ncbi:SanA/YdcF family protein [Micromonospora radicis]|uniref:SanA/YdcF family protein n=1 Tax=Micromonospora radicis TaxID=1894971 RepID=UPI001F2AA3D1|nr:ElyC/SanA/YdcF family protein [Micromonospora radicis]
MSDRPAPEDDSSSPAGGRQPPEDASARPDPAGRASRWRRPVRVVADPHGLDTYDSCLRAREVYGVERALIVTQSYHLSRAVTLCRQLGIDAVGVPARCSGCGTGLLAEKAVRDYFASGKAAWDAIRRRPPAVDSPTHSGVSDALAE